MTTTPLPMIERFDAYAEFQEKEGIPIVTGFAVHDLKTVEVKPWARLGGLGTYVNLDGTGGTNDALVCEIPPGAKLNPERHLFEKMIYVLTGRGATMVGDDESNRQTFEWHQGSVFSIPVNTWHQHFNGSGSEPARFLAVTNAPMIMNMFHNHDFIFNNPFQFKDRHTDVKQYQGEGTLWKGGSGRVNVWETNFIPDVTSFQTYTWKERGAGGSSVMFELAHNTMAAHVSQFPVGTYKKAHRHGPGAHVIILSGHGFSLLWPRGGGRDDRVRIDWKPGAMVVPPTDWFHEHFNGGAEPARYLALRWGSQRYAFNFGVAMEGAADVSEKEGGAQIEYEDEDPTIHQMFERDLEAAGATCRMKDHVPWCTGVSQSAA